LPRVKKRRLLVAACAAFALMLACMAGELRGAGAIDDESGDVVTATDSLEALPAAGVVLSPPQPLGGAVYVVLQFPPSRMTTADVFRPPQA
jgi:hypothetical protein